MSAEERETLSLGLAHGQSLRTMASVLGRAPSTVSREHARNAVRGPYRACTAHTLASARARQPRRSRKLVDPWLWQYVRAHLAQGCSPEQIAGRLRRAYPGDMQKPLSAETISVARYVLPRGPLTDDRGKEMAEHERLAQRLSIQVFFADPYSPWPRGTNENTNGWLRQDLPKGTDLSGTTQRAPNVIAHRLNTRPRTCLNFATPLEVYAQLRHHSPVALGT